MTFKHDKALPHFPSTIKNERFLHFEHNFVMNEC